MDVDLLIRDGDACRVEGGLGVLQHVEVNVPVIGALAPQSRGDLDARIERSADLDERRGILQDGAVSFRQRLQDLDGLVRVGFIGDVEGLVDSSGVLLGVVDDGRAGGGAVGQVDDPLFGEPAVRSP